MQYCNEYHGLFQNNQLHIFIIINKIQNRNEYEYKGVKTFGLTSWLISNGIKWSSNIPQSLKVILNLYRSISQKLVGILT